MARALGPVALLVYLGVVVGYVFLVGYRFIGPHFAYLALAVARAYEAFGVVLVCVVVGSRVSIAHRRLLHTAVGIVAEQIACEFVLAERVSLYQSLLVARDVLLATVDGRQVALLVEGVGDGLIVGFGVLPLAGLHVAHKLECRAVAGLVSFGFGLLFWLCRSCGVGGSCVSLLNVGCRLFLCAILAR